jgi:hypothetical protein
VFGFATAFIPTILQVLAKAFTVFAFLIVVISRTNVYVSERETTSHPRCGRFPHDFSRFIIAPEFQTFSPFAFEYDVNPTIHRPYLKPSEPRDHLGTADTIVENPLPNETHTQSQEDAYIETLFEAIGTSSAPSSPLTLQGTISAGHLETPASVLSTASPLSPSTSQLDSSADGAHYACPPCQEVFLRRCDLK